MCDVRPFSSMKINWPHNLNLSYLFAWNNFLSTFTKDPLLTNNLSIYNITMENLATFEKKGFVY
jgi:hypothetical protein